MIDTWVSNNFKRSELACPCCKQMKCHINLINALQSLRDSLAIPFIINSAYRCSSHNSTIPGAFPNSYHPKGLAFDVSTRGWSGYHKHKFIELTSNVPSGIGIYENFIHFDLRTKSSLWLG